MDGVFGQAGQRQVFAEDAERKRAVGKLLAPISVVFGGIGVDRFVASAVNGEIGLGVAVEIVATDAARAPSSAA